MPRDENPRCPSCGRALGLYNREGLHVADEVHYVHWVEVVPVGLPGQWKRLECTPLSGEELARVAAKIVNTRGMK